MSERFDPQDLSHWLLILAYLSLSGWIIKKVYFG